MKVFAQQSCLVRALVGLIGLAAAGAAQQQPTVASVRVFTEPTGAYFAVDDVYYQGPVSFLWPTGSKHTLKLVGQQVMHAPRMRYSFVSWTDSNSKMMSYDTAVVVTADPSISFFKAVMNVEYPVSLLFFKCPDTPQIPCQSPGVVRVNGTPYISDATFYVSPNSELQLQVEPNSGYVFMGWLQGLGSTSQSFVNTVIVKQATDLYPRFARAALLKMESSPPGLKLLADRTPVRAPMTMEWGMGSPHTVGVISPQLDDNGKAWVFESWSDGGAETHAYMMGRELITYSLTANFVRGTGASFLTSPPGLKLSVDGRDNWQGYNFTWAPGTRHSVSAPEKQVDARGQTWLFREWSNGGPISQEVVMPESAMTDGFRLVARYDPLGKVTVRSVPAGVTIAVDGENCAAPCTLERTPGAILRLTAPQSTPAGEGARLDFASWSDGAVADRRLTVPAEPLDLTATFRMRYRLAIGVEPKEAAGLSLDPASADGFFDSGQTVTATLEPRSGFKFKGWQGDASGLSRTVTFSMPAPQAANAVFDKVPYVGPDGVRNAAGATPLQAVAAGSIVEISGVHLAPEYVTGPENPMAQTLAGTWVRLADALLPLVFVSSERIQALLPGDLAPGDYKLYVGMEGQQASAVNFRVERNAPGLYQVESPAGALAMAFHEDGTGVTPQAPARRGERIVLLGTGFGPYTRMPLAGFPVPASPEYPLADPVELKAGEVLAVPEFAGAMPGKSGIVTVRFTVPAEFASGALPLKARVNGVESNTVLFSVE